MATILLYYTKRSTRQAHLLLVCRSILCQLFAQDWPNLCWGRFNKVEVNSIILYKLWYSWIFLFYNNIVYSQIYCGCIMLAPEQWLGTTVLVDHFKSRSYSFDWRKTINKMTILLGFLALVKTTYHVSMKKITVLF